MSTCGEYKNEKMINNYKKFKEKFGEKSIESLIKKYNLNPENNFFIIYSSMLINKIDTIEQFEKFYNFCLETSSDNSLDSLNCTEITRLYSKFKHHLKLEEVDEYKGDESIECELKNNVEDNLKIQEILEIKKSLKRIEEQLKNNEIKAKNLSEDSNESELKNDIVHIKNDVEELKAEFITRLDQRTEKKSTYKQVEEIYKLIENLGSSINKISVTSDNNQLEVKKETSREVVIGFICATIALILGFFISRWGV